MISFGPTEEQEVARDAMREFASSEIRPIARRCDEASQAPAEFLEQAWQLGLVATQIPEAFGGGDQQFGRNVSKPRRMPACQAFDADRVEVLQGDGKFLAV